MCGLDAYSIYYTTTASNKYASTCTHTFLAVHALVSLFMGVDTGGALGAQAPPDFQAQYTLYMGMYAFETGIMLIN